MQRLKTTLHKVPSLTSSLRLRDQLLPVGKKTYVMGILNVTPDSFSDGGKYLNAADAIHRLEVLIEGGADIIDVGGESTRPGAAPISAQEEIHRILPVLKAWNQEKRNAILSMDTSKSEVADVALQQGASLVNDVTALRGDPEMGRVVARYQAGVVLMHMKGTPRTMQKDPSYENIVSEIIRFFEQRMEEAISCGIQENSIILDPGIGFGKKLVHNLEILRSLREFKTLGRPLLVGPSRKSFIGEILDLPIGERLHGTAAAVAVSILNGADILRVHDVAEMKQVAKVVDALQGNDDEGRT